MISENQRLERLAERLRAVEPAMPSPAGKIRAWNLIAADIQKPAARAGRSRSTGRLILAGVAAAALLVAGAVAAAADSLPDSALYPVKGTVETIQGAFAFSAADRFSYHLSLAHTRLREAEAMFARPRIDLADQALVLMEGQLSSASDAVKAARDADPAVAASLSRQLAQAIESHDNQLASLQGQVTNPTAVEAITEARNRAQQALQAAATPADQGQGTENSSASAKPNGRGTPGGPSDTIKPSHRP